MNENDFDLKDLVEREANIWACIYRAINRKKDNNEFDEEEEEEDSELMQINSMNDDYLLQFKNNELMPNNHLMPTKKYPNLQVIHEANDCSKIEEEDDSLVKDDSFEDTSFADSSNPDEPRAALEKCLTRKSSKVSNKPSLVRRRSKAFQKKISSIAKKSYYSSMTRMNSEKSQFQSLGTLKRSSGEFKAQTQSYLDEEMLAVYYISIVIRL